MLTTIIKVMTPYMDDNEILHLNFYTFIPNLTISSNFYEFRGVSSDFSILINTDVFIFFEIVETLFQCQKPKYQGQWGPEKEDLWALLGAPNENNTTQVGLTT